MDVGLIKNQMTTQFSKPPLKGENNTQKSVVADGFQKGSQPETLDADRMKNLQMGKVRGSGRSLAMNKAICIGATFAGIITGAVIGGPFAPALMLSLGALYGGAAILALR